MGFVLFFLIVGVYIGGLFGQLVSGKGLSFSFFRCIFYGMQSRYTIVSYFAIAVMGGVLQLRGREETDNRNFTYSDKGTFGTAGFLEKKESLEVTKRERDINQIDGFILGEVDGETVYLPIDSMLNRNFAVCGCQGSMKSRSFSRNMILQCAVRGESVFATDPKSELYEDTAAFLEGEGYCVKQLNLIDLLHSDSWACLNEVDEEDMDIFVDVLIRNTTDKFDSFHDSIEMDLLKALCLYVKGNYPRERQTLPEVYNLLVKTEPELLDEKFASLPNNHPAKAPFMLFSKAEKIKGNAIAGLGTRLQILQNRKVQAVISYEDIDLIKPGKEKCAYFCIVSDQDSTYDALATLFVAFFFIKLVRYADSRENRRLPIPVHMVLDEFPNIGAVPDFKKKLATARSRGIGIDMIFQNIPQLKNRYPDEQWEELLGGCDITLFLGCNDLTTAEYFSKRSGEVTVQTESVRKNLNTMRMTDYVAEYSTTTAENQRMLLTPNEVLRFPMQEALVIIRGHNVMRVRKLDYTRHPMAKRLKLKKTTEHMPLWREKYARTTQSQNTEETNTETSGKMEQKEQEQPQIIRRKLSDFAGLMKN